MTVLHHHHSLSCPNTKFSTRPSPAEWADTPYRLINTPRNRKEYQVCSRKLTRGYPRHSADGASSHETGTVFVASEMANVHNMILRGLNSIVRQAPFVPDSSRPGYDADDVQDLVCYVDAWVKTLAHHHHVEETVFFPLVEQMTGVPALMDELEEQHEEFHDGLLQLKCYIGKVIEKPHQYRWQTMKTMIESFAPALVYHLHDEIDFLLSMDKFSGEGLRHCWLEAERVAMKTEEHEDLYEIFPFIMGNCDRTYEGKNNFPTFPKALQYAIKFWYSSKHKGAWRFNCCDFEGKPVPLQFLPENRDDE